MPASGAERWRGRLRLPPVLQGVLVPAFHRLTRKTTVHYELLPPEAA